MSRKTTMNKTEIKKRLREIELAYDYSHRNNEYECVFNLDQLADFVMQLSKEVTKEAVIFAEEIEEQEEQEVPFEEWWDRLDDIERGEYNQMFQGDDESEQSTGEPELE